MRMYRCQSQFISMCSFCTDTTTGKNTTRSCAAQDCKAKTSSIPRMPGEQWLYYVVSLIINLSFILLPWKSLQHLRRRRDDDHVVNELGNTRIARTSHRWLQNRRIPTIEPGIRFLQRLARSNSVHGRISEDHPDDGEAGRVFILPPTFSRRGGINKRFVVM